MAAAQLTAAYISAMKKRADAAREFTHTVGSVVYTLRRPPHLRWRELVLGSLGNQVALERSTVLGSVVSWTGPTVADVDPAPDTPEIGALALPCTPDMVELYLADRAEHFAEISAALMGEITRSQEEAAAAKKA